jgi:hypothetical protein
MRGAIGAVRIDAVRPHVAAAPFRPGATLHGAHGAKPRREKGPSRPVDCTGSDKNNRIASMASAMGKILGQGARAADIHTAQHVAASRFACPRKQVPKAAARKSSGAVVLLSSVAAWLVGTGVGSSRQWVPVAVGVKPLCLEARRLENHVTERSYICTLSVWGR